MGRHDSRYRHGFTLVELLVVIAIIAILIALLLPAVQAAREAARRTQCLNHFKQIGVALHNYHSSRSRFPPGAIYLHSSQPPNLPDFYGAGWAVYILPYLELINIDDLWQDDGFWGTYGPNNIYVGKNRIATFLCPSDPQDELLHIGSSANTYTNDPDGIFWWNTNVAGIADKDTPWSDPCQGWVSDYSNPPADGMLFNLRGIRVADVFDGTSNTLMVGEITGGEAGSHQGWIYVNGTLFSTAFGINGPGTIPGEGIWNRICDPGDSLSSYHPGGCHFLRADGSAHFTSENVDAEILAALTTRAGGEVISSNGL